MADSDLNDNGTSADSNGRPRPLEEAPPKSGPVSTGKLDGKLLGQRNFDAFLRQANIRQSAVSAAAVLALNIKVIH